MILASDPFFSALSGVLGFDCAVPFVASVVSSDPSSAASILLDFRCLVASRGVDCGSSVSSG